MILGFLGKKIGYFGLVPYIWTKRYTYPESCCEKHLPAYYHQAFKRFQRRKKLRWEMDSYCKPILFYIIYVLLLNKATWIGRKFYHSQHRKRVHITHNSQLNKENTQFWREEDYWRESCKYISVLVLLSRDQKLNFL